MENQKMPEYETIRAAVAGEKWAVEKVVECYKDEIDRLSTVAVRQPDGSTKQESLSLSNFMSCLRMW